MLKTRIKNIIIIFILLIFIFAIFKFSDVLEPSEMTNTDLADYYIKNAYVQTGAANIVTSIYLNYRVYDTLFEALMLFIGVAAIIYFSKHGGDLEND